MVVYFISLNVIEHVPDMELGHWVTGSMGHLGHLSRPGHRVIILTRCETRVFPVFEKMPKTQNVHLKCWNDQSHCQVSVVLQKSLDVSPCNELLLLPMTNKNSLAWEYFFTHKSTFGVHYRTRSPGQLGLRVAGFPGHWVAGSQNVTQFHLWHVMFTSWTSHVGYTYSYPLCRAVTAYCQIPLHGPDPTQPDFVGDPRGPSRSLAGSVWWNLDFIALFFCNKNNK